MRATLLVVVVACLMGALLALMLSPRPSDEGPELVSEQQVVTGD